MLRTMHAALSTGLVHKLFCRIVSILLNLASVDLGDLDGRADDIGGALLTFRAFGHQATPCARAIHLPPQC